MEVAGPQLVGDLSGLVLQSRPDRSHDRDVGDMHPLRC